MVKVKYWRKDQFGRIIVDVRTKNGGMILAWMYINRKYGYLKDKSKGKYAQTVYTFRLGRLGLAIYRAK